MSPELKFILAATVWPAATADFERVRRLAKAVTDEDLFFEILRRHRITPLVFHNVVMAGAVLPGAILPRLKRRALLAADKNRRQITELIRLSQIFTARGVRSIVLKGAPLAVELYGSPFLRENNDIDFLIEPSRIAEAEAILFQDGYKRVDPTGPLAAHEERVYRHYFYHALYHHSASGMVVELHWRLVMEARLLPCDVAELLARAKPVEVSGVKIDTLPQPEALLFLCAHGAGHAWWRIKWLLDVERSLDLQSRSSIEEAAAFARQNGLAPCFDSSRHLAGELSRDLIGSEGPNQSPSPGWRGAVSKRIVRRLLLAPSLEGRFLPEGPTYLATLLYEFVLLGSRRSLIHGFIRLWLYPADWRMARLPKPLFPLHVLIRPVSWLARNVSRFLGSPLGHKPK